MATPVSGGGSGSGVGAGDPLRGVGEEGVRAPASRPRPRRARRRSGSAARRCRSTADRSRRRSRRRADSAARSHGSPARFEEPPGEVPAEPGQACPGRSSGPGRSCRPGQGEGHEPVGEAVLHAGRRRVGGCRPLGSSSDWDRAAGRAGPAARWPDGRQAVVRALKWRTPVRGGHPRPALGLDMTRPPGCPVLIGR